MVISFLFVLHNFGNLFQYVVIFKHMKMWYTRAGTIKKYNCTLLTETDSCLTTFYKLPNILTVPSPGQKCMFGVLLNCSIENSLLHIKDSLMFVLLYTVHAVCWHLWKWYRSCSIQLLSALKYLVTIVITNSLEKLRIVIITVYTVSHALDLTKARGLFLGETSQGFQNFLKEKQVVY